MNVRPLILATLVAAASIGSAVAIEHVAIAAGESAAASDAGVAEDLVTPAAATPGAEVVRDHRESAQPRAASVDDPVGTLGEFLAFARSGKGRLAVGAALVLIVWLLNVPWLLGRFAFFGTKLGKYTLGFGSAALLYVGTALGSDDVAITFNLIGDALVAGFAASGKWEALRDVMARPMARAAAATTASMLLLATTLYLAVAGCRHVKPIADDVGDAVIDCVVKEVADKLPDVIHLMKCRAGIAADCPPVSTVDWPAIEQIAINEGKIIGGCALASVVNQYLAPAPGRRAPAPDASWAARDALERFRAREAGGATFKTTQGNL